MYKCTFSDTGDDFALENLYDAYSFINIECMSDTSDRIKK